MKALYSDSIMLLLRRRWPVLCPDLPFGSVLFDVASVKLFLTKLSSAWATSIMKTWSNASTTSLRMHEHTLRNCVFGCRDEPDTLSHYLRCSMLWQHLGHHTPANQFSIADRLLLTRPSFASALDLVTAFFAFNAARHAGHLSARRLQSTIAAAQCPALCSASRATRSALNVPANMQVSNDVPPTPSADEVITPSPHTPSDYVNYCHQRFLAQSPLRARSAPLLTFSLLKVLILRPS